MKIAKTGAVILVVVIAALFLAKEIREKDSSASPEQKQRADFTLSDNRVIPEEQRSASNVVSDPGSTDAVNRNVYNTRRNAITAAVEAANPAVVGISTKSVRYYRRQFTNDPFMRLFFPDEVYRQDINELGSGFIISAEGYVITNAHVVEDAEEITVTLTNQNKYTAKLINLDSAKDIALLKIDGDNFPFLTLGDSKDVIVGEWVIAFGNPFGLFEFNNQPSVTVGVISASERDFGHLNDDRYYNDMIQTDASINTGNSGGPLINSLGEVIGVNTFIFTGGAGERGSVGVGFAIPINKVKTLVGELKATAGEDETYYTGITVDPISEMTKYQLGLESTEGALITKIDADSPAEQAGLKVGDVIVEIDDNRIRRISEVKEYINRINPRPGRTISIKVIREKRDFITKLTLGRR